MDICEKLRWMADKYCNELTEAAEEIERLREERKSYSAAVERLDAEVAAQRRAANEHRNAAMEADLRTQAAVRGEKQVTGRLTAIVRWLEANQPNVFKRGLWDAIDTPTARTTLCWNCNTDYPIVEMRCPSCRATNANRDPETAATEVRAKKCDRSGQRNENNEGRSAVTPNAKSQATDAALSRQVACTDGLGVAVPPAQTFDQGDTK